MKAFLPAKHLSVLALLLAASCPVRGASPEWANGLVAMVNDTPITVDDIKERTAMLEEQLFRQHRSDPATFRQKVNELRQQYLEILIDRQLIHDEFETKGYTLPESVIEDQVQDRIRREYGDRRTLTQTIIARGSTYESWRRELRKQIIVDALTSSKVNSVVLISPNEIERYYRENQEKYMLGERVRLWMIFIAHLPNDAGHAPSLLGEVRRKILEGSSFSDMASVYDDGVRRSEGGDWGWVERTVLREDLAQAAFSIEKGGMSEVINMQEGCYLMHVQDRKPPEPRPLSEVREDIEIALLAEERNRLQQQWISTLRKKGFIRYY